MRVRKFRPEDARILSSIIKKNFLEINSQHYPEDTVQALIKNSTPKRLVEKSKYRKFFVALEKDKILGIGGYQEDDIHTFFVRPRTHGKGVGKALMERVLKEARKEGIRVMNCASTEVAVPFYQSCGFKKLRKKSVEYFGSKLDFVQMKMKL